MYLIFYTRLPNMYKSQILPPLTRPFIILFKTACKSPNKPVTSYLTNLMRLLILTLKCSIVEAISSFYLILEIRFDYIFQRIGPKAVQCTLPWKETLLAQRRSNALTGVRTNSYARMNQYSQSVHIHQPKNCRIFSNIFELVNSSSQSG